jgi:hypothetical protein
MIKLKMKQILISLILKIILNKQMIKKLKMINKKKKKIIKKLKMKIMRDILLLMIQMMMKIIHLHPLKIIIIQIIIMNYILHIMA